MTPEHLSDQLEYILPKVQKPGRYTGGELNQILKDWDQIQTRVALVFPDIYDLGMSNLGLMILYDLINQRADALAERVFSPWSDMEEQMREFGIPLYALESRHPVADFDIIGFSLPYETLYTNLLNALDLGGIPLRSADRADHDPLIIAGGHAVLNPEPMYAFVDAFVIGEGEEVMMEIIDTHQIWKKTGAPRSDLLVRLSQIWGVYVPALYKANNNPDGTFHSIEKLEETAPLPIVKRIVAQLPPPVTKFIVPYVDVTHNRIPIEIMRGCTRGCRFCHAGMITRPVRERTVAEICDALEEALDHTGFEEVGLLSLSSSDYTHVVELVEEVGRRFADRVLSISLPSLRIETMSVDLMDALRDTRRSGFTLAPEAATERMRQIINKPVSSQELLDTAREIYSRGYTHIKLYFMIGHPAETMEDVEAIVQLCRAVLKEGRNVMGKRAKVTAGVSTFIPKPHTPFQWVPLDNHAAIVEKLEYLKKHLRGQGLKLNWNNPEESILEAALTRGDRRLAEVIYKAWEMGAKFDAWYEHFDFDRWRIAFDQAGVDMDFYTYRARPLDEIFPWEHLSTSIKKKFLTEDYLMSLAGETRIDCREQCFACGVLPVFTQLRRETPGDHWGCPEVKSRRVTVRSENQAFFPKAVVEKPISIKIEDILIGGD